MAVPYNKLKGHSTEKIFDGAKHALAMCEVPNMSPTNLTAALYHGTFVPAFKARLGIKDDKFMPSRSTLETVYRGQLARKEEETLNAQRETHNSSRDAGSESSDSEEDNGSKGFVDDDSDDDDDEDDDDDDDATSKVVAQRPTRVLRGAPKPPKDPLAEEMAPARATFARALVGDPRGNKKSTREALRTLGLWGKEITDAKSFQYDDKPFAMRCAAIALPKEHGLDLEQMPDSETVWRGIIGYYQGLGDGALKKRIAATQKLSEEASLQRLARPQNDASLAIVASAAASKKRSAADQAANEEAERDLIACGVFSSDGGGALPGSNPFRRAVVPKKRAKLMQRTGKPVWAVDLQTNEPILVKSGPKKLKLAMCAESSFQLGAGVKDGDQEPIAIIERTGPDVAAVMLDDAWCGGCLLPDGTKVSHRGQDGPGALLIDVSQKPLTWVNGGEDNPFDALSEMGLSIASSEAAESAQFGTLSPFQRVTFEDTGGITGGLVGLDRDCKRLMSRMRDAVTAHADGVGGVFLAPGVPLQKLAKDGRSGVESSYRFNILAEPQRCAGEINDDTLVKLEWLESEGFDALYSVAYSAALLGYVQVRVLAYAHESAGRFHFDSAADGPKVSKRMATALAAADPANLDSLNFSLEDCPVPARMGPVLGPT